MIETSRSESAESLFGTVLVGSPLRELQEVYEQKSRGLEGASTAAERQRLDRAYDLAVLAVRAALGSIPPREDERLNGSSARAGAVDSSQDHTAGAER